LFALMQLYYVIWLGLLNSNFIFNFVARCIILTFGNAFQIFALTSEREFDLTSAIFSRASAFVILEIIFYVQ